MSGAEEIQKEIAAIAEKVDSYITKIIYGHPSELYEASRYIIQSGGKRLRPYLTTKTCELFGKSPEIAVPYASALEILHNFTLIHDDIMDHDECRRGKPTVHAKFGTPMAILAGDLLYTKVYQILVENSTEGLTSQDVLKCVQRVIDSTILLCEGQALDILYPESVDIKEEDYFLMIGGKTSALFSVCAEVGAIVGGANERERVAISNFAWDAGMAFQIVDDVLGITADEEELGKPVGSDILEGKKTIIMIHALENANPEQREKILGVLGNESSSKEEIEKVMKSLKELGSIDYAKKLAEKYKKSSLKMLESFPESTVKQDLVNLVRYFVERSY